MGPLRRHGVNGAGGHSPRTLHVLVPGPLDQRTGGYIYDGRMIDGLGRLGWRVVVHELDGAFPGPDARGCGQLDSTLAAVPAATIALVDGLASGAHPEPIRRHAGRLRLLTLVHHPIADETGRASADRDRLLALERVALAACAGVIVTSTFTATRLEALGVPRARIRVAPPGTDAAPVARGPEPGQPPQLLCVASVTPRKGLNVLVDALARIRHLPWHCVCAGSVTRDAAHAATVRRQVVTSDLEARIQFVGECDRETLDALYDSSSIFVLPSHYEGYGMVLSEALARGLPIVSTTGGAIPSTVPPDCGLLVSSGDDEALATALGRLLTDHSGATGSSRRAALSAASRRHAQCLPTWDVAARTFERAIDELTELTRDVPHSS